MEEEGSTDKISCQLHGRPEFKSQVGTTLSETSNEEKGDMPRRMDMNVPYKCMKKIKINKRVAAVTKPLTVIFCNLAAFD